jgi:hypothetical protein
MTRLKALALFLGAFAMFSVGSAKADSGAGPEAMTMGNMCMVMFGYIAKRFLRKERRFLSSILKIRNSAICRSK